MKDTRAKLQSGVEKIYKAFASDVKAVEGQERQFGFTITTSDVDRENDVISADGWELDNYLRNPVVLFAHDYHQPPVGVSRELTRTERGLSSICEFAEAKDYAFAGTIAALVRMGALRATSVGFRTLEWSYDEVRSGVNFTRQELLEYSIVPVPANPHALIEARSAGIDVEPLREWYVKLGEAIAADPTALRTVKIKVDADTSDFVRQIEAATGAIERLVVVVDGLKGSLVGVAKDSATEPHAGPDMLSCPKGADCQMDASGSCPMGPGECPKKYVVPSATKDSAAATDEAVSQTPVTDGSAPTQVDAAADDTIVLDDDELEVELVDDDLTDEDIRAAVREALSDITKDAAQTALNRRLGRVD